VTPPTKGILFSTKTEKKKKKILTVTPPTNVKKINNGAPGLGFRV
jgi:hypothetical protein